MIYLISPYKKQYKANLHSHSTLSDGKRTPEQLKQMYKAKGYSILSITDHEKPMNHSCLNDPDFITITGYEAYIRDNPECKYDPYKAEVHMNLFARDPENTAIVCYNPAFSRYIPAEQVDAYEKVGSQRPRELTVPYVNEFIKTAKENGYIVSYNHPWWSLESEERILQYDGFFSLEMCNYDSYLISRLEYNAALYDKLVLSGKRIFCHSVDDNHNVQPEDSPQFDSFRVVAGLYAESVQLVTMDPEIKSVTDLKGKAVSIGAPGSGVYFNAMDVLAAAGLTEEDIKPQYLSFGDSADGLKDGKIDAAFIVAGAPTAAISELCTTNSAYLVPIDGDIAAKLMESSPFYTSYVIPAGTYNGQTEDVTTVTVKATLIVSASASEDAVYNLTKAIFDNAEAIAKENGKGAELSIENATSGMTAPFHAGAAKYFAEKGVTVTTN